MNDSDSFESVRYNESVDWIYRSDSFCEEQTENIETLWSDGVTELNCYNVLCCFLFCFLTFFRLIINGKELQACKAFIQNNWAFPKSHKKKNTDVVIDVYLNTLSLYQRHYISYGEISPQGSTESSTSNVHRANWCSPEIQLAKSIQLTWIKCAMNHLTWHSGSPKRQLNSRTFGPCLVNISPAYKTPERKTSEMKNDWRKINHLKFQFCRMTSEDMKYSAWHIIKMNSSVPSLFIVITWKVFKISSFYA